MGDYPITVRVARVSPADAPAILKPRLEWRVSDAGASRLTMDWPMAVKGWPGFSLSTWQTVPGTGASPSRRQRTVLTRAATGKFTGAGVFTITEVRDGPGSAKGWGRLKSGAGWISLDFAQKF